MFTRPLVFAVILTLVVIIIYGSFSMTDVSGRRMSSYFCQALKDPNMATCCAVDLDTNTLWCVDCTEGGEHNPRNCSDPYIHIFPFSDIQTPTPKPTPVPTPLGPLVFPEDGVLQQPTPTPSPLGPRPFTPLGEGTIQQPQTTPTPPPLFGRNVGNVPLGGFFGPTTPALTPPPQFGQIAPEGQVQPPPATSGGEGGEGGQETQSRTISPTGYCVPFIKTTCVPCDPGLPGANCVLQSEWPPASTTGEDIPQAQLPSEEEEEEEEQPPGALPRPPAAGIDPEAEIAPDDEGTQPQTQEDAGVEE